MTTNLAPKYPSQRQQPHRPDQVRLKPLSFAFPFLRKGQGKAGASARFTDEHDIYRLLATREPSGAYLVSTKGMWHGGIHVTENGAGQSFDLDAGVRCIADGHVVAYRINRTYPESAGSDENGRPFAVPYSTGFALVRHTMSFPNDATLTFYSLYMHLMSYEDYANFASRQKPRYWPVQWRVTQFANDRPGAGRNGQTADAAQLGLRIRTRPRIGSPIGILPQGASVSIGKQENGWGRITEVHSSALHPPTAGGFVSVSAAVGGWIHMREGNGAPLVEAVMPDSAFERVTIAAVSAGGPDAPEGAGIPIKAGDLVGHLGRYDSLAQATAGTRMVHLEVFCDDSIKSFIEQGRNWVDEHGPHKEDWDALGLSSEPTILRVEPDTVLYQRTSDNRFVAGADALMRKADVIQTHSLAELGRDRAKRFTEQEVDPLCNLRVNWWHVESANALGHPIEGWVREFNHPGGGRVTREFAQEWIDFQCIEGKHDPAHTVCNATSAWIDYASRAEVAEPASRLKLSPLMLAVYDALFTKGDGKRAVDELCALSKTEGEGYPWRMRAASRLVVKHESEWANPSKWKQLIAELERTTGPRRQHEEEKKRIEALVWWDEVKAGVAGFPGQDVFHVNPIAMVSNHLSKALLCKNCGANITPNVNFFKKISPNARPDFVDEMIVVSVDLLSKYGMDTCRQMMHFLAQAKHETRQFSAFRESLNYKSYTAQGLYEMAHNAIDQGFYRKGVSFRNKGEKIEWIQKHLIANDAAYGEHCFGSDDHPGKDFRGRGLLHLTHYENYKRCAQAIGYPIDSQPELVENDLRVVIESGLWYWKDRGIGVIADDSTNVGDEGVKKVTRLINPGYKGISERQQFKREISSHFNEHFLSECTDD